MILSCYKPYRDYFNKWAYTMDIKELGDLIRNTRKQQGLTQQELAGICGVGVRFVRELEHGKQSCHMGKALWVIKMLGIQVTINGIPM